MNDPMNGQSWWDLHLRKARGEVLSKEEQRLYDTDLARQENDASPLDFDLDGLKRLRAELAQLVHANVELRARFNELDSEIRLIEKSLSPETREALGVKG